MACQPPRHTTPSPARPLDCRAGSTLLRSDVEDREVLVAREQRRLAAIVAADVVGYSRLMGRDDSGTVARLKQNRAERLGPILAKYGGRLVKLTGDGALVEFASAVDALSGAIEFQQAMSDPMKSGSGPDEATKRAAYYRERAAEAPVKAQAARGIEARRTMLQVAGLWDYMAETAEPRSKR